MARPTIDDATHRVLASLDVARQAADFETPAQTKRRDEANSVSILAAAATLMAVIGKRAVKRALSLAWELDQRDHPLSLASARHMRDLRRRVVALIWALVLAAGHERFHAFTIIPRTWLLTPEQLWNADPRKLMAALRTDLYRPLHSKGKRKTYPRGATASGCIVAFIHGEFDRTTGLFQLHVHGIACGEMIGVVSRLRHRRNYRWERTTDAEGHTREWHRVQVKRDCIGAGPGWISYLIKSYWQGRFTVVKPDGSIVRSKLHTRIPEPYHSLYLLWLSRWRLHDLSLLIHVRTGKESLVMSG